MNKDQFGQNPVWAEKGITICIIIGILLLVLSLGLSGLDAKSLWQDEIFTAAIASTQHSAPQVSSIALHNTALPTPPLYFLITHFFLYIGDNDFLLRFPALCFGVLSVALTYALGTRFFGQREGLAGAFLLSISALHIRYSQEARFYTLLVFLSLLSLYFLYRGVFEKERKWWIGFTLCSILNVYAHLFAFLVLLAESVFVAGLWLAEAFLAMGKPSLAEQTRDSEKAVGTLDERMGLALVASLSITTLAYTPMFAHLLRGAKVLGGKSLTQAIVVRTVDAWGLGSGWAIFVLLIPFLIGIIISAKAQRRELWLAFCWLMVPFGVLCAVPARHGFRPRYVLFMVPLYLLFVAKGLTATSEVINVRLQRGRLPLRETSLVVLLLAIGVLSVPAVKGYYEEDRANWRAAADLLATSICSGDMIVSPAPFAQIALPRYQQSLGEVSFVTGRSEVFFSPDRDQHGGLWFVDVQGGRMGAIENELAQAVSYYFKVIIEVDDMKVARSRLLKIAPAMHKDVWILYVREDLKPQEVVQLYEVALEVVPSSTAFAIHVTLGDLYRLRDELEQAKAHYQEAIILEQYAPEPHYGLALVYKAQGLWEHYMSEWRTYEELTAR